MTIQIDDETAILLRALVQDRINELGPEIHHTRTRDFRDELQRQRDQLEVLIASLDKLVAV